MLVRKKSVGLNTIYGEMKEIKMYITLLTGAYVDALFSASLTSSSTADKFLSDRLIENTCDNKYKISFVII